MVFTGYMLKDGERTMTLVFSERTLCSGTEARARESVPALLWMHVVTGATRLTQAIRAWISAMQTRRRLSLLDDRVLEDIGVIDHDTRRYVAFWHAHGIIDASARQASKRQ
jgi:uncharacterized protein YjiS (DUF1127 family)